MVKEDICGLEDPGAAPVRNSKDAQRTTLINPISVCYYSELRSAITSYSGVQILQTKDFE